MDFIKQAARNYWIAYYLVYVACIGIGVWRYRQHLFGDEDVLWLAAIFGASAGFALLAAILLEVTGRMVLLIPAAIKKIKEEGRQEGIQEGRQEGRRGVIKALAERGTQSDGSVLIHLTRAELDALLEGYDTRD